MWLIVGLTESPIVLSGDYAQTYRPGHHNISEDYVFDPWLEPGMSEEILEALESRNLRAIIVRRGLPATPLSGPDAHELTTNWESSTEEDVEDQFIFWGLDNTFRRTLD